MAGSTTGPWRMEEYAPSLHSLAQYRDLGKVTGDFDRRTGRRMVDDRCQPLQGSPPCRGCTRRKSGDEPYQRGLNTEIHMAADARGLPIRVLITPGTTTDCTQASKLIAGIDADDLIADRGYDTDAILQQAVAQGMHAVIPPKKNRTVQGTHDQDLHKPRHLVENTFLARKQWRGIATRYAKNSASFLTAVHIRCLVLWLKIS